MRHPQTPPGDPGTLYRILTAQVLVLPIVLTAFSVSGEVIQVAARRIFAPNPDGAYFNGRCIFLVSSSFRPCSWQELLPACALLPYSRSLQYPTKMLGWKYRTRSYFKLLQHFSYLFIVFASTHNSITEPASYFFTIDNSCWLNYNIIKLLNRIMVKWGADLAMRTHHQPKRKPPVALGQKPLREFNICMSEPED